MENPSFIEIYDNALTKRECGILISEFENSSHVLGKSGYGNTIEYDPSIKKSIELKDIRFSDRSVISVIISKSLHTCMDKYTKKFTQLNDVNCWRWDDSYTFKKYETAEDGFKQWHTEHGSGGAALRMLVWAFYLNNAKSGTEFRSYPTVKAKEGRCVIWPSSFTHLHRSEPNKGLKYIVSGWVSFE